MAGQVGALRVVVGANIAPLQNDMRRAQRTVAQGAGAMQRSVTNLNKSFTGLGTVAGVSLGAAGLLAGAGAFLRVADAAKSLTAQLKLATAEYGSFEKAQKDVRNIAEQTRSDLLATAELYSALQRNSGQLGTTQEQVARATRTVAEAFKISGAATSEQSAATRQLIQAFQSGVLRGDEFNSIMENAPRLAKLLADSLGVTTGALRKMAEEGELTADKLVRAFTDKKFTEGLDAEFRQLPVTFDEAMGQVYNAAIVVFSAFDRGGQFSNSIANFVSDGTEGFTELESRAYKFGEQVGDTIAATEQVRMALGSMKSDGVGGFLELIGVTYSWRDALADTLGVLDSIGNTFSNALNAPGNLIRLAFPGLGLKPITDPFNMKGGFLSSTNKRGTDAARQSIMGRSARDVLAEFGMERRPPPFRAPPSKAKSGGGKTKQPPRDRSADVEFQFSQELRQAQMDVLRAQQSLAVSSDERARIALQILAGEREMQEAELNDRVRRAERDFAEKKITAGALEQVKVQAEKLRAEYDSKDALERQAVAEELAAQKAQDAAALVQSDYDLRLEHLQTESALADTAAERRDVELRILQTMKEQERARLEAVIADKESSELAKEEARRRLAQLDNIYAGREAVTRRNTVGPLESAQLQFSELSEEMENLKVQGLMGLSDAFATLITDTENWKQATISAIKSVIAEFIRLQTMKFLMNLVGTAAGVPGAGSMAGGGMGAGNIFGVDPMFLSGIPGFASGGSMMLGGMQGIDKNLLSLNGLPIARVSYGERLDISNDNQSGGMAPPFIFNNYARMSAAEARQTGAQAAAGWKHEIARVNKKGF